MGNKNYTHVPHFFSRIGLFAFAFVMLLLSGCSEEVKAPKSSGTAPKGKTPPPKEVTAPSADQEGVRQVLEHLFEVVRGGDFSLAAPYIMYTGADEKRAWKTSWDYEDEAEKLEVDKMCAKMQVILNGAANIEYVQYATEKEREGLWRVWVVKFTYEDGTTDQKAFAFLPVRESFGLGDIDGA